MKKKVIGFFLALLMVVVGFGYPSTEAKAEGLGTDIDYSYLLTEDALIGYSQLQTRGIYLVDGSSVINKIGTGKIGAGGITNASRRCRVSVAVLVERLDGSSWNYVTSWTVLEESGFSAIASRSINVGTGHYYRVRCTHHAATDTSSSWTGALWM